MDGFAGFFQEILNLFENKGRVKVADVLLTACVYF